MFILKLTILNEIFLVSLTLNIRRIEMLREKDKLLCLEIQEELGRYNPRPIYKYVKEDQKQVLVYMTDKEEIVAFLEKYEKLKNKEMIKHRFQS